jgi:predicted AlkP superfamily phosphohydrolase/phosphomutase
MLWGPYDNELLKTYQVVDEMLGWVREAAGDATLLVMSDHGFAAFDRAVHLNSWLHQEGFLTPAGSGNADDIDWSRTKAYAMGLNAIYVNQQFRERDGVVAEGEETMQVIREVRERLLRFRDPVNGKQVVYDVAMPEHQFDGEAIDRAPDLVVGYSPGYRSSWQTALGAVPDVVVEDNLEEWRGDHCIHPQFVPGVLLGNRTNSIEDPRLDDVTVTILQAFGIDRMPGMQGRNLYPSAP